MRDGGYQHAIVKAQHPEKGGGEVEVEKREFK